MTPPDLADDGSVTEEREPATVTPLRPAVEADEAEISDLRDPSLYLNRELTWLAFNERVLNEARDPRTRLLERVKFLAIASNNLDEFFMKRIGGLKQQLGAGVHNRTVDGRTPQQQLEECTLVARRQEKVKYELLDPLLAELAEADIRVTRCEALSDKERRRLREYYLENIFPLVTPQAIDPAHPFPFVSNVSLNLLVTLHHKGDPTPLTARVKVPVGAGIPRFLASDDQTLFVPLEDVMADNLDLLFPGMDIAGCNLFRITRNAITEIDEEQADDLLAMIESELRERKFAPIVRLQVSEDMTEAERGRLIAEFGLNAADLVEVPGMLALRDLWELVALDRPELKDPPHHPTDSASLIGDRSIFHTIRDKGAILLHHPYESYTTSVERFLLEASRDPKVRAIKMTLYRTSERSDAVRYLIDAARNGKQVAVVVELKARFDEEANIRWAGRLEEAGIHVSYGVVGLKTHCKLILVVRQDYNGLRRYAHLGTGNYHAGTARLYTDLGLLTADEDIGHDLTELFNYLTTGYKPKRNYKKVLPAPKHLKQAFLKKIEREIAVHSDEEPGLIQMKMNALEDVDIVHALYRASRAGVRVDLIVRDSCRLRPGLPGFSENVRVMSIVGRFLEHARVFYFKNAGVEEYYMGSADLMKRNLESRVESVVPVESPELRARLRTLLDLQLADQRHAWDMTADGTYVQRTPSKDEDAKGVQERLAEDAVQRHKEATRLKRRKARGVSRRSWHDER